jgi:hypothetical protein
MGVNFNDYLSSKEKDKQDLFIHLYDCGCFDFWYEGEEDGYIRKVCCKKHEKERMEKFLSALFKPKNK